MCVRIVYKRIEEMVEKKARKTFDFDKKKTLTTHGTCKHFAHSTQIHRLAKRKNIVCSAFTTNKNAHFRIEIFIILSTTFRPTLLSKTQSQTFDAFELRLIYAMQTYLCACVCAYMTSSMYV